MYIVCSKCGSRIKRNVKRVTGLKGSVSTYHRECWDKIQKSRTAAEKSRSEYRARSLDRIDDRRTAQYVRVIS